MINEKFTLHGVEKKKLVVFDLDETLVHTDSHVKILSKDSREVLQTLSAKEFNSFVQSPDRFCDFQEFCDPEILNRGKVIVFMLKKLVSLYMRGVMVSILTARASSEMIRQFMKRLGVEIHPQLVIAINDPNFGFTGSIPERKLQALDLYYEMGFRDFTFFDDDLHNLQMAQELENMFDDVIVQLIQVDEHRLRKISSRYPIRKYAPKN